MKDKKQPKTWFGLVVASVLSAALVYYAFRNVDFGEMFSAIAQVPWYGHLMMALAVTSGLFLRAWRWWFTLPDRKPEEFMACQRALALGYGLNNLGPRLGEVARIVVLRRRGKRPVAQITSSVILDRLVLDLAAMCVFLGFALIAGRSNLEEALGPSMNKLPMLVALAVMVLVGCFVAVFFPKLILSVLGKLGFKKFPTLWKFVEQTVQQIIDGLSILGRPKEYPAIAMLSVGIWVSYVMGFVIGFKLMGIEAGFVAMILVYTVTMLGMAVPSPGGIGTVHALGQFALIHILAVDSSLALTSITYIHGINYLLLCVFGFFAFWREGTLPRQLEESHA